MHVVALFVWSLFPLMLHGAVVDLTDANFEGQVTKSTTPWLVKFYAPWCGHCKKLAPAYDALGDDTTLGEAKVGRVDCTVHKIVCTLFGVRGYPTLKVVSNGKYFEYKGARTQEALKAFLLKPHVDSEGTVVGQPPQEQKSAPASGKSEVVVLTDANFDAQVTKSSAPWMVKFYAPWCGHCKKLAPTYDELSLDKDLKNAKVGKIDCTVHKAVCSQFGVKGYPTLKVIKNGKYHDYKGARSAPALKAFLIKDHDDADGTAIGKAPPAAAKTEEAVDDSKVEALTPTTFNKHVQGGSDGWMLKFYAPWCGHCKKLAPDWGKLGAHFHGQKDTNVKVGKIDCTQHRDLCSKFEVKGYPSLFFFKDGTYYKYSSARNLESLKQFATGGYASAKDTGKLEGGAAGAMPGMASIMDSVWSWVAENTVLAAVCGIILLAISVAVLVAILDCCMGAEAATSPKGKTKKPKKSKKED